MKEYLNFIFEFIFSDAFLGKKPVFSMRRFSKKGFFNRIWRIAKTIKHAYYNQEKQESTRHKNKIWFYVRTKNQFNAVEEVYKLVNFNKLCKFQFLHAF